jgi:polar amino acid transport system substrate-binding protein
MRAFLTSFKKRGLYTLCVLSVALLTASPTAAQPSDKGNLPLLFDARERLAMPDLSAVQRVRFLTTVDFPPFNFADQAGRLSGFHVDLAREICAELKIEAKCQIQAMPFADLQPALLASTGDAVMAGVAVSADLRRQFDFSRPFLALPARFVRNLKTPVGGGTAASLSGLAVGVVGGTAHEAMLKAYFPQIKATAFDSDAAMLEAVRSGAVAAGFADGLRLSFWASSAAAQSCCALFDGPYLSEHFLGEGLTIMVRKNDVALAQAFDHALAALSRNGRLQEIYLRYFPYGLY